MLAIGKKPGVSIVIPTLNEEALIEKCLRSLRNQTLQPSEIIVVDGYSEDRTVEIARKHADKIIHSHRRSIAYQREVGCHEAKEQFILLADADTVFCADWLEKAVENFNDEEVAAVTSDMVPINPNIVSSFNCWFRNMITPGYTQRAACFLFRKPEAPALFSVNGYVSKLDITPLRKRLNGRIVKDSQVVVKTHIPWSQQVQTVLILAGIAAGIGGAYALTRRRCR